MTTLRGKLIRLAHSNLELRPHILPILASTPHERCEDGTNWDDGTRKCEDIGSEGALPEGSSWKNKTYAGKYHENVKSVMDEHKLKDDDADEVKKFKKDKPKSGVKLSDAELMRKFLQNAKPETKERMKGLPPADFVKMLGAILEDEE